MRKQEARDPALLVADADQVGYVDVSTDSNETEKQMDEVSSAPEGSVAGWMQERSKRMQ